MRYLTLGPNDSDQRLDRFLGKYLPRAPKTWIQKMIREKKIKVNKKRADPGLILKEGDQLSLYIYDEVLAPYEKARSRYASRVPLSIIYENANIAIIDKQAGVLVHAASPADYGNNIVDAFVAYLIDRGDYLPRKERSFTPAIANRLDFNTAGLLIGLKNHQAAILVNQAIREGKIRRYYRAYCQGRLDQPLRLDHLLKKEGQNMVLAAPGEGQPALTLVEPIRSEADWSYVDIELLTGRYHQIRAHLNAAGHPLIGDPRYGKKGAFSSYPHQLLLAWRLQFPPMEALGLKQGLDVQSRQLEAFEKIQQQLERREKSDQRRRSKN